MVTQGSVDPREADAFLETAVLALAWLDARGTSPRRMGAVADARWRAFAGAAPELSDADRLTLLLRDAATVHPAAFSARAVFALPGLCDDEPIGARAIEFAAGKSAARFRSPPAPAPDAVALFDACAAHWGLAKLRFASESPVGPTTRLLIAGPAAMRAACERFAGDRSTLDAGAQWIIVADTAATRQLAGVAAMALGARKAPTVIDPAAAEQGREALARAGIDRVDRAWVSDDATAAERAAAAQIAAMMNTSVER